MMSELENVDLNNELFIVNSKYLQTNCIHLIFFFFYLYNIYLLIQGTKEKEDIKEGADINDITQMMNIKKDLSSMSDREKRKLLMKESPELFGLITDFKSNSLYFVYIVY